MRCSYGSFVILPKTAKYCTTTSIIIFLFLRLFFFSKLCINLFIIVIFWLIITDFTKKKNDRSLLNFSVGDFVFYSLISFFLIMLSHAIIIYQQQRNLCQCIVILFACFVQILFLFLFISATNIILCSNEIIFYFPKQYKLTNLFV